MKSDYAGLISVHVEQQVKRRSLGPRAHVFATWTSPKNVFRGIFELKHIG